MTFKNSIPARNTQADAWAAMLNGGSAFFYSGAPPASPDLAATGTLIGTQTLGNPAFAAAVGGTIASNPAAIGTTSAAGSPGYVRLKTVAGVTWSDMDCATSGATATINKESFATGEAIALISLAVTWPAA